MRAFRAMHVDARVSRDARDMRDADAGDPRETMRALARPCRRDRLRTQALSLSNPFTSTKERRRPCCRKRLNALRILSMAGFLRKRREHSVGSAGEGTIMKGLHTINCVLFLLNALLWAWYAKQPVIALLWLSVSLGEAYVITRTDLLSD